MMHIDVVRMLEEGNAQMQTRRSIVTSLVALGATSVMGVPAIGKPAGMWAPADPGREGSKLDALVPVIEPVLNLRNSNTGEVISGRYYSPSGYDVEMVQRLNWFMRDWRERQAVWMDVRLFWGLSAISEAAIKDGHDGIIQYNSGYRTEKTNSKLEGAARNSMHLRGQASDFYLLNIPPGTIYRYARWLGIGGVGNYSSFTHIDTGADRHWGT